MADNDNIEFKLDLDAKEMTATLNSLKDQISGLSEARNLEGLIDGLTKVGQVAGVVGAAFFALKSTMDVVFNAEQIKQVNNQFEAMTQQAGIATDVLKDGLKDAAKGLVDDTDLLRAANKAIVEMGSSAKKLPELMELARKSAAFSGSDILQTFENLNRAIATGNQKMLKNMGIIIDTQKAEQKYADSVHATVSQLTEEGKRHAILNEVLEKGKINLQNVDEKVLQAKNTWTVFLVTLKEIGETFTLLFEKLFGPTLRTTLTSLKDFAVTTNLYLKKYFGDGAESVEASTTLIKNQIKTLEKSLEELNSTGKTFYMGQWIEAGTDTGKVRIKEIEDQLAHLRAQIKEGAKDLEGTKVGPEAPTSEAGPIEDVNKKKQAQDEAKFQAEIARIKEEAMRSEMKNIDTVTAYSVERNKDKEIEEERFQAKLAQIKASETLTERQKNELIEAESEAHRVKMESFDLETLENKQKLIEKEKNMTFDLDQFEELTKQQKANEDQQYAMKKEMLAQMEFENEQQRQLAEEELYRNHQERMLEIDMQYEQQHQAVIDRWSAHSDSAIGKFGKGFAAGSMKAADQMKNFGAQGAFAFNSLSTHASNAFIQMGAGAKKGSDAMRGAMFGLMADIAQNYGAMALQMGLVPPNPIYLAAGAALLALSGFLRSKAGGSETSSGGGGGGGFAGDYAAATQTGLVDQTQRKEKQVTVQVQGHYFETEQTKTRLLEMIREGTDVTDFKYVQVGQ